jgi:hypothetical protein
MNPYDEQPGADLEQFFAELAEPVTPEPAFRAALEHELAARLVPRRGEAPLPPGWALCPFDRFCIAEQRLPHLLRRHCPCLHAGPLFRRIANQATPVHARPCTGLELREKAADTAG